MDGKVLKYNYLNGKIEQEAFYKKNKRNGTYKNYDDDGNLIFDCFYKDDVITDYCYELTYNSEGKFIKKSPFDYMAYIQDYIEKNIPFYLEKINGRQDGKIELMDGNGNISVNGEILNGKKVNEWRYYDNKNNLIMSEYFTNGFLNGDRNVYNSVGAKIKQIPYKNGLLHGIVVEWDEVGEVSLNMFYKYGSRIKVRTTFYEEFYSKSVKTSGNLQVKSLDELEEISDDYDIKIEVPYSDNEGYPITELVQILDFKIAENPKGEKRDLKGVKFDTTYHNSFFVTTQISTVLKKKDLQTETKNFDDILFNVETTIDGSYVLDRYRDYKPMKNEFILFYQNSEYDISHQQIEVRIGSKIKKAINNNSFNGYAIVELLDGGIFYKSKFPGSLVFRKMEEEAKKE
jgi:antitoxin component YwqK of YwqJK toxin-antitoxin module